MMTCPSCAGEVHQARPGAPFRCRSCPWAVHPLSCFGPGPEGELDCSCGLTDEDERHAAELADSAPD